MAEKLPELRSYRFEQFELDAARFELRRDGAAVPVEPQVLALLLLLVGNRERLVTLDEIIEVVWNGRIVSDSAVSSRIKSARRALDDDGRQQRLIRTVHGKGFRFVGAVEPMSPAAAAEPLAPASEEEPAPEPPAMPSLAVLPLRLAGPAGHHAFMAEALPHELISELSRVRWLFVIARGSSFRFGPDADAARIGRILGVRYCLSGSLACEGDRITVTVELSDTRSRAAIWGDRYTVQAGGVHEVRAVIVASIIAALEIQIPLHEARGARLTSPENLDAWSAYHLGLQQMYRFTRTGNEAAIALFGQAIAKEPDFARAHAGLSFTHFQNAFLKYVGDVEAEAAIARRYSERAFEIDALDPFVNLTLGRSFWLRGDLEGSLPWLERSVTLSPSYAQGIYAQAWADTVLCRGAEGRAHVDKAMALSPIDPLRYAMLGTRALAHLIRGENAEAAQWADRAARAPNAHVMISVIAVACHALNGDDEGARRWAEDVRRRNPRLTQADFFQSFPFEESATRNRIAQGLARYGI